MINICCIVGLFHMNVKRMNIGEDDKLFSHSW